MKKWHYTVILGYFLFAAVYGTTQHYFLGTPFLVPKTPMDHWVPFVPETAIVYCTHWLIVLAPFALLPEKLKWQTIQRYLLATLLAGLIFVVFPTTVSRPPPIEGNWGSSLLQFVYSFDKPLNCLPSLHVALSFISATAFAGSSARTKYLIWIWALLVSLSTLTTKQHVLLDGLAGVALAVLCIYMQLPGFRKMDGNGDESALPDS